METITIREYLTKKGIEFVERNGQLLVHCIFDGCGDDDRPNEKHLYFNEKTSEYDCKKCGEQGNIITLARKLGDGLKDISLHSQGSSSNPHAKQPRFNETLVESHHQALPLTIRQYLNARGIIDAIIDSHKLGWGWFYGKWWITIPIQDTEGIFRFFKLREDPYSGNGKITYPKGATAQIYGWDTLKATTDKILICEGELDRLALLSKGVPAITSTHGAGTFKDEWCEKIGKGREIYICYDNDDAGKKGSGRVAKIMEDFGNDVHIITLPEDVGDGGDITDYFVKLKGTPDDLFGKYAKKISELEKSERIKQIAKPEQEIDCERWRNVINDNFPELLFASEMGLSVIAQILINEVTNPFALVLVDVPSSGKTISINFFSEIKELTYASDKFTPASFVSNASNVRKDKLTEIDLLPRLKYKMFLIRDLATLFSKRDDDLNECLGLLTRVLDGEGLNTDSGIHGQRQYVGEYLFMVLAGSTPIPPRVWKMMGNLGSRLFFLNMGSKNKSEEELAGQLTTLSYKEKEKICRIATKNFLYTLWSKYPNGVDWDKSSDQQEDKLIIVRCAKLLAKLRGVINVWPDKTQAGETYEHTHPVVEKPDRINQLFYNLCRGHALVCGRFQINKEDLRLIVELAADSAPTIRAILFRKILENDGQMKTATVMTALNCSRPTAHKEMEVLKILGVCRTTEESDGFVGQPEKTIHLSEEFEWFLTDECRAIRGLPLLPQPEAIEQEIAAHLL